MSAPTRWARAWLGAGAALGLALAILGVVRSGPSAGELPPQAAALVGSTAISLAQYTRAVAAVAADRREQRVDDELRRHVLARLIEEELLVQGALALGLPTRDARLRGQLASAMLDGVIGEPAPPPDEPALRAFHAARAASFTRRGRVQVDALYFGGAGGLAKAEAARARLLAGEPLTVVAAEASPQASPLPGGALPLAKVAEYVGPAVARAVGALAVGGVCPPIVAERGAWVARLVARRDGELAAFEDVRGEVLAQWRREEDDRRLRRWLDQRRDATRVVVRPVLP